MRVSEALARMSLQPMATAVHVQEALRLFHVSTLDAAKSGVAEAAALSSEQMTEIHKVETRIRQRVPIGGFISKRQLVDELGAVGINSWACERAIHGMKTRHELDLKSEGRKLVRLA